MKEIDFRKASYDELLEFAMNLLALNKLNDARDYEAKIAYFSTATQVGLARRASESMATLAHEVDQARSGTARGLEKLTLAIANASDASDRAAVRMEAQTARLSKATWGLVGATVVLALATILLVFYTRALVIAEHTTTTPGQIVKP
jgi:hypothetical protein